MALLNGGVKQAPGGHRDTLISGRPAGWFRKSCKDVMARIDVPEFWGSIAEDKTQRTSDRMEAVLRLTEFAEGKAHQSLEVTNTNEVNRPSTESLIETIRALRDELKSLRDGAGVQEAGGKV